MGKDMRKLKDQGPLAPQPERRADLESGEIESQVRWGVLVIVSDWTTWLSTVTVCDFKNDHSIV